MDDINRLELDWPFLCLELERLQSTLTTRTWVVDDVFRLGCAFDNELRKREGFCLQPKKTEKGL